MLRLVILSDDDPPVRLTEITCIDRKGSIPVARRGDRETIKRNRATETPDQCAQLDDVERAQRAAARESRNEKVAHSLRPGDLYRFADGTCRKIGLIEESNDDGQTWTEVI